MDLRDVGLLDNVGIARAWLRKMHAFALVAGRVGQRTRWAAMPQAVRSLRDHALAARSLRQLMRVLWRIENLGFAAAHRDGDDVDLRALPLPEEAGPPLHLGLGMAGVLATGFEPERLAGWLERRSNPRFADFAHETVGVMLCVYEPDFFGRLAALLGRMGILRLAPAAPFDAAGFLRALPGPRLRLAAHGFGRLLYFKSRSLRDAVGAIHARPHVPFEPAVKGAVTGHALVNVAQLDRVLSLADAPLPTPLRGAVRGGLGHAIKLLEWTRPGCLAALAPATPTARELLVDAGAEARDRRARGQGPGFAP